MSYCPILQISWLIPFTVDLDLIMLSKFWIIALMLYMVNYMFVAQSIQSSIVHYYTLKWKCRSFICLPLYHYTWFTSGRMTALRTLHKQKLSNEKVNARYTQHDHTATVPRLGLLLAIEMSKNYQIECIAIKTCV